MFYFYHQIKLQTIPYVEKQIASFIEYFDSHLNLREQLEDDELVVNKWSQKTEKLTTILNKKYKQIQNFHYENWMDYRASLIFRSKMLLVQFFNQNQNRILLQVQQNQQNEKNQQFMSLTESGQEVVEVDQQQKKEPEIKINQKAEHKNFKKKTSVNEKQSKQKSKMIKTPRQKIQEKKTNTPKVSKNDVNKVLSKIIQKGQKGQGKDNKKRVTTQSGRQMNIEKNLQKKLKRTQKQHEKTTSKDKQIKSISKSKLQMSGVSKLKTNLAPSNGTLIKNQNALLADSKMIRQKKMTKQEYVEYLQNKNKLGQIP